MLMDNDSKPRAPKGQFQKGRSGNPGGRPKKNGDVVAAAREHTATAIHTLAHLMQHAESEATRAQGARILLERGWGAPTQYIEQNTTLADEIDAVKKRDAAYEAKQGAG